MYRLDELVARLGGELRGDGSVSVCRVAPIDSAGPGDISFLANPRYAARLQSCKAAALLVKKEAADKTSLPVIITPDPYLYFAQVARLLNPAVLPQNGIHSSAVLLSPVPDDVHVGAGVVIAENVTVHPGAVISAGVSIGAGAVIGANTFIHPRVTIYPDCRLGARCIVHSGAVIGADGFGFARQADGSWLKIPQVGRVILGDDVEVGANTTIDRGALGDTVIGDGVKLDNQIQIAHNVRIGDHTAIAGCVGIAGSTVIGKRCMIGGQAGIVGHLEICDDVVVSAGTLVFKSIRKPGVYTSSLPVQTHADWVKNFAHLRHLDTMAARLRAIEHAERDKKD